MNSNKAMLVAVFVTLVGVSMAMVKTQNTMMKNMNPIDACLFACNMCFGKEKVLLECANDVCLKSLSSGKPLENSLWVTACPGLAMFFK
jgi:hypothetical protein